MHRAPRTMIALAALALTGATAFHAIGQPQAETKAATQDRPAAPAAPAKPAAPAAQDAPAASPRIVEGTVPVYTWAPKDESRKVDAANLDLKHVFEQLGPVATQWYQHVLTLSNPFFEGRAPGSRGTEVAAEYLEFWFKRANLAPAFPEVEPGKNTPEEGEWKSYRQHFRLPGGAPRQLEAKVVAAGVDLEDGRDFSLLAMCGDARTEDLPVAFAGYAIDDGPDGYSSFGEDENLKGKAVMCFRYEPLTAEGKSRWAERRFSKHNAILAKFEELTKRGAAAIIVVAPPGATDGRTALETVQSSRWSRRLEIPVLQISTQAAERLLKAGDPEGKSLLDWRMLADEGKVKCVTLGSKATVRLTTRLDSGGTDAQNVGAVLRGKGSLADQWIVVGAHYDHVGYGYFGSSPDNAGQLHPGADDNASGTASLLVLAQQMSDVYAGKDAPAEARSILFLAFTAEESGLRGSKHWVEHPTIAADKLTLMVNMDMVGRLRSDTLAVYGVGSAKGFMDILRPIFEESGLIVHADPAGRGPSDHASFYGASVPVLFMHTGNHDVYHTPADFGYTLNPEGGAKVVQFAKLIVTRMGTRPERLEFASTEAIPSADRGYAGVRLGVMPGVTDDSVEEGKRPAGVLVEAVSAGTSAEEAGIKKGDVLLKWNGEALEDTGAMMKKLREHKPGDVVDILLWRDGKESTVKVTLKASTPRT